MNSKFNELFNTIITENKDKFIIKEDVDIETAKANFEAIVAKVKAAFDEYGVDCNESEDEDEDGVTINAEWRWVNKNGIDDYLGLSYCNGEATEDNNGGTGDLDLDDVEGTADYLIQEYIFNPEYGGIGCEDRTLDEVVPELLEKWKNNNSSDFDWDSMDLDEIAEEFIDENYDNPFETEEDIADELNDWLYEHYSKEDDQD